MVNSAMAPEFRARTTELDFTITGMSCAACAARIEKSLRRLDGVDEVAVSFPLRTAWIQMADGSAVTGEEIADKIEQLGFVAVTNESAATGLTRERRVLRLRVIVSVLLTFPLLLGMTEHIPALLWAAALLPEWLFSPWLQLALATVVQFAIGMPFYFGAYYALRQRSANMDVLVVLGTSAAYLYSHYVVFRGGGFDGAVLAEGHYPLYFETSAVVITAVLLGKYIEASASLRANEETDGFGRLNVATAVVERAGEAKEIRTEFVREGDIVVVEAGAIVPVDGIVSHGESTVDESLLTGESAAPPKRAGDPVWAGTRNEAAPLKVRTTAAGYDTRLSRIRELVKQGQRSKSSLQSHVDKVASWFVPAMLVIAALTFLLWGTIASPGDWGQAAVCAIAVLLAACPCALGLAAPISLVIASGKMAERGIIAKDAAAVERLASVETLVLDKTGTLTEGKLRVSGVQSFYGSRRMSILRIAAALEAESAHPLAAAIRTEARRSGLVAAAAEDIRYTVGGGVEGVIGGERYALGNARFIERRGWTIDRSVRGAAVLRERLGETVLYAVKGESCIGIIGFSDNVRRSAGRMAASLHRLAIAPVVATGDHEAPALAVARVAGIAKVRASMLPEDKLALVEDLKRKGNRVAMAGDGWNDAPALAAADVGIAMGSGTDAALGAGHLTLLTSRLTAIPEAIRMSRLTIRNIRQNLLFAFLYNIFIIPFAVIGLLEPWMAGTAMALSSVSVVGNALRLKSRLERAAERKL